MSKEEIKGTGLTADEVITRFKQASVRRLFPGEYLHLPVDAIEDAARAGDRTARRALKLLIDRRFDKR